jgi:uncharacterized protein DUF4382
MRRLLDNRQARSAMVFWIASLLSVVALASILVSCGANSGISSGGTGTMNVSMTDPPSCKFPNGSFTHVYISIRSVQAHTSATANDNSPGWQELAPQLNTAPMQIDLLAAGSTACLLATLGSNTSLPAGDYQQIRLLLVPNSGGSGPTPTTNNCNGQGFNCVVLQDNSIHELDLSSQANTGLKIPPGQIVGGPISVGVGQDVDLNIDFNACASIIQEGTGQYRLKPVLTAEQVSTNNTGISGQIVDSVTKLPVVGGTAIVALEKQDLNGTDTIFMQQAADSSGNFNFCPLPAGLTFDVVAVAINGAGVAYNATVETGVPGGTNAGMIPLTAETGLTPGPATFQGFVTATTGTAPASIDALVSAIQIVPLSGGGTRPVTIPAESTTIPVASASIQNISVASTTNCPSSPPPNANCAEYTLIEPASNPSIGAFSTGIVSFSTPAASPVLYSIRVDAFVPLSGGTTDCTPSSIQTSLDSSGNPLQAVPGPPVTPNEIDFAGCS